MAAPQGLVSFPGVNAIVDGSIHVIHGVSPSVATLTIAPQAGMTAQAGDLVWTFAGRTIRFVDCKIDRNRFERNAQGLIWRLAILDRRWKWTAEGGGGAISGRYNLRDADGKIRDGTEKTPQELASLCLDAMGEGNYDVADLPSEPRPEVDWDFDLPAAALANLCDPLGCRVVLQLDNRVALRKAGVGAALPTGPILEDSLAIDLPQMPDRLAIVTGATLWQVDLKLEAVGLEMDGSVKPIDDLSYRPAAGWSVLEPPDYLGVGRGLDEQAKNKARELVKASVFRWYRIALPISIPRGPPLIKSYDRILPITAHQVETIPAHQLPPGAATTARPAIVYGVWLDDRDATNKNTALAVTPYLNYVAGIQPVHDPQLYNRPFTVDTRQGIVKFGGPVRRNLEDLDETDPKKQRLGPAQLRLRTAIHVRDPLTRAVLRYTKTRETGGRFGTPTRYYKHDELVLTHRTIYDVDPATGLPTFQGGVIVRNLDEVDRACDHYLDAALQEYQVTTPQSRRYAGLGAVELDGAIQHLTLSVGGSGATTTVSRNTEMIEYVPPYKLRRQAERARNREQALPEPQGLPAHVPSP